MSGETEDEIRDANRKISRGSDKRKRPDTGKVMAGRREAFALNPTDHGEPKTPGENRRDGRKPAG